MGKTTKLVITSFFMINILSCAQNVNNSKEQKISGMTDIEFQNNLPQNFEENITALLTSGRSNEDVNLNITQLIQKYGYHVETHEVQTCDEYRLTMFRIPRHGPVVFLMHGLLSSADDWITAGPASGLAYLLANEGFDVWLGNARGNKHSRRHARLSPDSEEFWDFSWDEIGRYDLPAMIDYALHAAGQTRLRYVGHSQGTTAFFVLCSERPQYNDKISLMVALAPVAWMSHLISPLSRLLSSINHVLFSMTKTIGLYELLPDNDLFKILKTEICGKKKLAELHCANILFIICGFDYAQINVTNLPVILGHVPSGASAKQLVHYGQGIVSGNFQKFDYGPGQNPKMYGSNYPPSYRVERITAPVAIFYSDGDWLASVQDVKILHNHLKNVIDFYKIPLKPFNHLDFIWAKDIKTFIFSRLMKSMRNIN